MKEGQTQEPVGGMKWEDVQILAKKHAEHIIEMGWRDNPDKDDIIADFISGYVSATPPDVEAFSKRVIDSLQRFYELGDKTGYSNSELSRIRSCIEKVKEIKAGYAVPSPVGIDVEELAKQKAKEKYPGEMNMRGYKINAQKNNQEKFIEGFKAGYSASLPQSSTEEEKKLWEEARKIVIKHYTSYNYTDQDSNELQSKFKISKR